MINEFHYTITSPEFKHQYNDDIQVFKEKSFWGEMYIKIIVMLGLCLLVSPLNLLKNISALRFTTIAGIACIVFVLIVFCIQLPEYLSHYYASIYNEKIPETHIKWFPVTTFDTSLVFIQRINNIILAYVSHYSIFPIYANLHNNTEKRIKKVIKRSTSFDFVLFFLLGFIGYLTQPYKTPELALSRNPIHDQDLVMGICRLLMAILIFVKIPVLYNSVRITVCTLIWNNPNFSKIQNVAITFSITLTSAFIGAVYSNIMSIVSFLGGFTGIIIAYAFPAIIYVKANNLKLSHWKNISIIVVFSIITIIGFTGAVLSVKDFIESR